LKKTGMGLIVLFFVVFSFYQVLFSEQQSVEDLKKLVQHYGKLNFKEDVPVNYLDRMQLKKYINSYFENDYPDERGEKESIYFLMMGFTKLKLNIKKLRKDIILANIGGLYNEKTGELFVLKEFREIDDLNAMVILHELRHSIQDQHFPIFDKLNVYSDFDDRKLAVLSAIEGDATLVMLLSGGFDPSIFSKSYGTDILLSFSPLKNSALLYQAPDVIKQQMIMPYFRGLGFSHTLYKRRKWKLVNTVLKAPPQSSEQILHPEKYLKKEVPIKVTIDFLPSGMKLYHSGVIGEYYLNVLLMSDGRYSDRAVGWGGDLFKIYMRGDKYFFMWESIWDKDKFCANFFYDFKRFVEKFFDINFKKGTGRSGPFIAGKSKKGYFFLKKGRVRMFYARSNDRQLINEFINGGIYD